MFVSILALALTGVVAQSASGQVPSVPADLLTVAEKSDFKATARHVEVVSLCERLVKACPNIRLGQLGVSHEGRMLPMLIIADPPVASAEEARASGKLVVFAMGNIHAGEVDGKEALPMLAREMGLAPHHPLLKNLILLFAPIYNADGNERVGPNNRPGQLGPEMGMGIRTNAQGLDLNRDFIKLDAPETRSLVRMANKWDPAIFIDCHTTNGSYHRYVLTYDGPRHPLGGATLTDFVRDVFFPDIDKRFAAKTGKQCFYYGNFNADNTKWEMYGTEGRYGTQYFGFRRRLSVLSEAYAYASYKDRVLATRDFVKCIVEYASENVPAIRAAIADEPALADNKPKPVAIRAELTKFPKPVVVPGYVEERKNGRRVRTEKTRDYVVEHWAEAKPTLAIERPRAYLIPAKYAAAVQTIQRHGICVEELREDLDVDVEVCKATKVQRSAREYQKRRPTSVECATRKETRRIPAGTFRVACEGKFAALISYLLEPASEDGLLTWGFFDDAVKVGEDLPVLRQVGPSEMLLTSCAPLPEDEVRDQPITFESLYGNGPYVDLNGAPILGVQWLADGEHFLQTKSGKLHKVHAATGKSEPHFTPTKMQEALAKLPTIGKEMASSLANQPVFGGNPFQRGMTVDKGRTGAVFEHENDLYYAAFDGATATRLTKTPGREELVRMSPDGRYVSFVRDQNLYVVDVATQTERALTSDGGGPISNGKADWVYFEELYNRSWLAYWWSPDSSRLVFLRFDDRPVQQFTVVNHLKPRQELEVTHYPKSGDPNPTVMVGVVTAAGGPVRFCDLGGYTDFLVTRVGFQPNSTGIYLYIQDRAQTWLDFCTCLPGGVPTKLFRETTKAWVDDPGEPIYLADKSFLMLLERSGWKHIYHFARDGKLTRQITDGPFEVRKVNEIDEKGGWLYFTGTKDSHIAENAYRVKMIGGPIERLTAEAGKHTVNVSPGGKYFVDSWSSMATPTKTALRSGDGKFVRTMDTNPVRGLNQVRRGKVELVKVKTSDGFELEGSLLKPPTFDPKKKYPVWFSTYGGPHAPQTTDSWGGGRGFDQMLAQLGVVVFHCDPRSASGKGAVSTWTCYRQLGVQELKDIEEAIGWLCKNSWIDATRIGMSGHSYGGFMTAYAMTHSKLFCCGIAGAPVTDWKNYDSIYTERFMNTPQNNPEGYAKTSVVGAARNLHGRLLLLHGGIDDNVHLQNTVQLAHGLQLADKDFEMMVYPTARHGIGGNHYNRLMLDFIKKNLKLDPETDVVRNAGFDRTESVIERSNQSVRCR